MHGAFNLIFFVDSTNYINENSKINHVYIIYIYIYICWSLATSFRLDIPSSRSGYPMPYSNIYTYILYTFIHMYYILYIYNYLNWIDEFVANVSTQFVVTRKKFDCA